MNDLYRLTANIACASTIDWNTAEAIVKHIINATHAWHPELRREARSLLGQIKQHKINPVQLMEYAEA